MSDPAAGQAGNGNLTSQEKRLAALSYLWVFFLIPHIYGKTEFTKFHANEGHKLFWFMVACSTLFLIPVVGKYFWVFSLIVALFLIIKGILNVFKGVSQPLPWLNTLINTTNYEKN